MSDILKNAVARAKVLRNVAIENAKTMLIESLDDKVEGILSNKLKSEMEDEDPDNLESTDDEDETYTEEDENQPKDDTNVTDDFKAEGTEEVDVTSDDDEDIDTELENIIRELDAEDDKLEDDETELSETEVPVEDETEVDPKVTPELEEVDGIKNPDDDEEIDLDLTDEGIEGDNAEGDVIPDAEDPKDKKTEPKLESLKSQNQKLKVEVLKRDKVINKLVEQIEELNLFNYKLAHTTKLFKKYNLSNASKMKVIETFDRAKTIREVKLIYATLAESYRGGSAPKVAVPKTVKSIKNINEVKVGASKSILSDSLFNATTILTEGTDFTNRLATLANLNKKK